jgi:cbb3-type cytochrome oxidase subunit 3
MVWTLAIFAFLLLFSLCAILSFFNKKTKESLDSPVSSYLLANQSLRPPAVISLLLSTSFGLNYLFFQIWLGYTVGAWGFVTQGAWVVGMILLGKFSKEIKKYKSLHELLGKKFGKKTRTVASICSIVGILFMMGWEAGVGVNSLSSIFQSSGNMKSIDSDFRANILVICVVSGCLFYTLIGGLRGNADADKLLNVFKILIVSLLALLLVSIFWKENPALWVSTLFPSYDTMRTNYGLWGLITGVTFSLTWQFVDNSTWQTIIAGGVDEKDDQSQMKKNLLVSGLAAFVAPGIIGTVLGIGLLSIKELNQDFLFAKIIELSPLPNGLTVFLVFSMIIACIMSLIDGLFLTAAYTLVIDIFHPKKTLNEIDSNKDGREKTLLLIRISLVLIAIISIWGVRWVYEFLDLKLFDCFYVMMITQLALLGPVVIALTTKRNVRYSLSFAILSSLIFGFSLVVVAKSIRIPWLLDGAGTFTMIFSCCVAYFCTKKV